MIEEINDVSSAISKTSKTDDPVSFRHGYRQVSGTTNCRFSFPKSSVSSTHTCHNCNSLTRERQLYKRRLLQLKRRANVLDQGAEAHYLPARRMIFIGRMLAGVEMMEDVSITAFHEELRPIDIASIGSNVLYDIRGEAMFATTCCFSLSLPSIFVIYCFPEELSSTIADLQTISSCSTLQIHILNSQVLLKLLNGLLLIPQLLSKKVKSTILASGRTSTLYRISRHTSASLAASHIGPLVPSRAWRKRH